VNILRAGRVLVGRKCHRISHSTIRLRTGFKYDLSSTGAAAPGNVGRTPNLPFYDTSTGLNYDFPLDFAEESFTIKKIFERLSLNRLTTLKASLFPEKKIIVSLVQRSRT
jgi:hypothetical protein